MNKEPCWRSVQVPEAEAVYVGRISGTLEVSKTKNRIANILDLVGNPDFDALIKDFEMIANAIVDDICAANERFFDHVKALL